MVLETLDHPFRTLNVNAALVDVSKFEGKLIVGEKLKRVWDGWM